MEKVIEEKKTKKVVNKKPKLVKKSYTLIKDFPIGNEIKKKGTPIKLTKKGRIYLKNNFYI